MTRPVIPRAGVKIRRQQRREFAAAKTRVEAAPSPQRAAYMAANRKRAAANRGRIKIKRAIDKEYEISPRRLSLIEWSALSAARQTQVLALGIEPRSLRSTV